MGTTSLAHRPPLARLTEGEIEHLLRGFPQEALEGARALISASEPSDFERCLFGILTFYLPAGISAPETMPAPESRLKEDLGLDSLALAEAMFKIEELFEIRIENSELAEIQTLGDARRMLLSKLNAASPVSS